jgi:hypothetical protein
VTGRQWVSVAVAFVLGGLGAAAVAFVLPPWWWLPVDALWDVTVAAAVVAVERTLARPRHGGVVR